MRFNPRIALVLVLSWLLAPRGWAQTAPAQTVAPQASPTPVSDWFITHVSLRQSLKDKNTVNKPATATLTFPKDGDATKEVNGALSVNLKTTAEFLAGLGVQFNENTALDSRQNTLKAGFEADWLPSIGPVERPTFFHDLSVIAGYKRNGEKHTDAFSADAYWTFSTPKGVCPWCPVWDIGGWFSYVPMFGVEYDRTVRATDATKEGGVTRALTELTVNVFPLRRVVEKRLTLTADVAYRHDVQSDFTGDRGHPYGEFSISYGLDPHNIFLLGVDYVRGENPDEGFESQRFVRLSLKVHFDKAQKESIKKARAAARARTP